MNVDVKNINGDVILSVIADDSAIFHEELMTSDYVQLSWLSDEYTLIPAGSYIDYEGEKYKLLDNYKPTQQDECTYNYTPQFQSRIMNWNKQIAPLYTYAEDGTTVIGKEMDWEFTGSPADAMYIIKQAIKNETGEEWTVQIGEGIPATISISSQSSSIFSLLNSISNECNTEWWADKKSNTLYLSKCIFGDEIILEVGNNVQIPSETNNNDGYYTRFYAFGSTRNITQDYNSGQVTNHIVNKRLTLNPAKYPNGYKDIKDGLKQEEVFVKSLYFDDIYPSSKLTISDVRARLKYRLDTNGNRIKIGGTDDDPIYEQYAIWYFQIEGFTLDKEDIIEGLNLSVSFKSGQLAQREFELIYHDKAEIVNDENDITAFNIKAGDYEIVIDESSGNIIPGTSYIIPQENDSIILFNIIMPDEYVESAQEELEKELDKAIASYTEDNNTYQFQSDPTSFYEQNTNVLMGQAVMFVNGGNRLSTRVQMVEKRLDLPCYQTIKVGNKIIKGNTQQLKDEVANVNQNIDVIKAFNDLSISLSNAYANAQREMIEGFAAIKNLWTLETDKNGEKYAYTKYNVLTQGGVTQYSAGNSTIPSIYDGIPFDNKTIWKNPETGLIEVIGGTGGSFNEDAMWSALASSSDNQINKSHLTNALTGYATESWVTSKNYATADALNAVSTKLNDFLEGSDTDTIINKWKELEAFLSGMEETDNLAEILETKADRSYVDSTFVTLATKQTITGEKTFSSVLNTAAIKASGAITAPSLAASDWVTIAGIKLRKLEDGALMLEGNLALTGALTMYASNGQSFDTIYDGLPIDNDTIYWQEVDGSRVLKAREGSGSSFDKSAMWTALAGSTTEQINKSHLTTALTGYATESWVSGKNYAVKSTTLAGYGITDGINAVSVTGTGNAVTAASISGHTLTLTKGSTFSLSGHKHAWADITSGKPTTLSGYGITDAYTKTESDGRYPTKTGSGASGTWGINVTGNAGTATKLQTARSLWGNNFDGTANISGDITLAIGKGIYLSANDQSWLLQTKRSDNTQINGIKTNGFQMCTYFGDTKTMQFSSDRIYSYVDFRAEKDLYINGIRLHKTADGVITLEGNLAVTGGVTMYAIDPVSVSTVMDGVVVDGTTIKKENGKLVAVGGGEAGSVAWGNISGKPSVFATNIANINDLHSSWDAVLKAQKPAWLTAVSIATISDLHANWDALLKAAPSAYVTRWPTISEVTGKQNLIVKLNGGTTEGTNQFTYNATGAKTINITPAGIGAAASSHNHSWSNITSGKPTTLAGYGITDAPTKTGSGASGTWGIGITGNAATASKWATARTITLGSYLSGSVSLDGSVNVTLNANVLGLTSQGNKTAATGNTSPASGVRLYQVYNNGYPTTYGNLLSVKGGGAGELLLSWNNANRIYYRSLRDNGDNWLGWNELAFITDNVASATKLQNTRTLWGQNFNGQQNVSGDMSNVGNINTNYAYVNAKTFAYNPSDAHDNGYPWYGFTYGGDNKIHLSGYGGISFYTSAGQVLVAGTDNRVYANSYVANDWFRSQGNTGWYSQQWGGGWYMSDANFIRSYQDKSVYIGNGSYRNAGGYAYSNNLENISEPYYCRYMSEAAYNIPTGYVHPFCGWSDSTASGWATSYVIGSIRNYANNWGEMYFGVYQYEGTRREWKAYMALDGANRQVYVDGNLMVTGGGTFYGSDIRYKSIIQQIKLSLLDIAEAPSFVYRWNKKEMICDRFNIGGSAQYTQTILPWAVEEKNNLLTMDYATVAYTFSVHTARHLLTYETRTDKKIKKLENRVKYLEKQLKKLGYEEASIVGDSGV